MIFGEPDIDLLPVADGGARLRVKVNGVDVFRLQRGELLRPPRLLPRRPRPLHYKALKTTLKAEIDRDAWETLRSDTSRPFERPASGRIAVKVINHLGDEVMKVFRV